MAKSRKKDLLRRIQIRRWGKTGSNWVQVTNWGEMTRRDVGVTVTDIVHQKHRGSDGSYPPFMSPSVACAIKFSGTGSLLYSEFDTLHLIHNLDSTKITRQTAWLLYKVSTHKSGRILVQGGILDKIMEESYLERKRKKSQRANNYTSETAFSTPTRPASPTTFWPSIPDSFGTTAFNPEFAAPPRSFCNCIGTKTTLLLADLAICWTSKKVI